MNIIDRDTVRHIARLSRISLNDDEVEMYSRQLGDILLYISKLNQLNTDDLEPTSHVLPGLVNVERPDVPGRSIGPEPALENAPDKDGDFFRIPKVIEAK